MERVLARFLLGGIRPGGGWHADDGAPFDLFRSWDCLPAKLSRSLLSHELGRKPTIEEHASRAKMTIHEIQRIRAVSGPAVSIYQQVSNPEDSLHFSELLPAAVSHEQATHELHDQLKKTLATLSPREREILNRRYGLFGNHTYSCDELHHLFQVTGERIRQIEAEAIRKLRKRCRSYGLSDFLD